MNIGRGYICYNQKISDDETWEETLKREKLIIIQVGREVSKKFEVNIFTVQDTKLTSAAEVLTKKEIQNLLNMEVI